MQKKKQAAALRYDISMDNAPLVMAKGEGQIADQIISLAKKHGVPVIENKGLLPFLMKTSLLSEIPSELYKATAIIFSKLMGIDKGMEKGKGGSV